MSVTRSLLSMVRNWKRNRLQDVEQTSNEMSLTRSLLSMVRNRKHNRLQDVEQTSNEMPVTRSLLSMVMSCHKRLWAQNLRVLSTVQSCHSSLVCLDTLWDICPLVLHHCVVTGLHSSSTSRFCAQSLKNNEIRFSVQTKQESWKASLEKNSNGHDHTKKPFFCFRHYPKVVDHKEMYNLYNSRFVLQVYNGSHLLWYINAHRSSWWKSIHRICTIWLCWSHFWLSSVSYHGLLGKVNCFLLIC